MSQTTNQTAAVKARRRTAREASPAPAGRYLPGERIKAWRERIGMTRDALARRLGVSERSVQYYEGGQRHCSDVLVCMRLAELMREDLRVLLGIPPGAPSTLAATAPIGDLQKRGGASGVIV